MNSRERMVETASQMFWRAGYSTTSPRQIMRASEVGQGSFYHHFPTKSDLGRAAIERNTREVLIAAATVTDGQEPALDRLRAYLLLRRDVLAGCRAGGFTYDAGVMEDPDLRPLLADAFTQLPALVASVVRQAQRDGSLRGDLDPAEIGAMMVAVVQGGYVAARATGEVAAFDQAVRGAVALLGANTVPR